MKFDIQIVPYRPEFRRRAAELRSSVFGHSVSLNEQYLDWKYHRNPFPEATVLYLALAGEEVVGMRGMFGTRWAFPSGEIVGLSQDADVMVAPEFRGRGLYRAMDVAALARMAEGGVSHMISMSANAANRAAANRLGWTEVGGYQVARRRVRGWPYGPEVTGRVASAVRRRLNWNMWRYGQFHLFDRRAKDQPSSDMSHCLSHVDPPGIADLIARSPKPRPIYPLRSPEYLSWRFDNPLAEYRFVYRRSDPIDGYLVLAKSNPWHVWIVDMEATDADAARELLMAAIKCSTRAALDLWTVSLAEDYSKVLDELDFSLLSPDNSPAADGVFMVRPTAVGDLSLMLNGYSLRDLSNWDLRMVSSDAY
jgi:GNAT superfamily N-acetyltransferase